MKRIKEIIKKLDNSFVNNIFIIMLIGFSFLIIDIYLRYFSNKYVSVYSFTHASPNIFSISWILFFIMIFYLFSKSKKIILYIFTLVIFNILMVAQVLHMKILSRFFGLSDILLTKEGSRYFLFALKKIDIITILVVLISLISMIICCILIKKTKEFKMNFKYYLFVILLGFSSFFLFRYVAINRLGKKAENNSWEASYNVKNIYIDYNNQSKNMEVSGLYEQTFKNSYLFIKELFNSKKSKINKELDSYFKNNDKKKETNNYTGVFKDKNMIFILMESIDTWLINDTVMPTLNKLSKEGFNFTNRYAPTFGGGQTINSEFAMNTGLYAIDNSKAIYNYDSNYYKYSLANLFKNSGYTVNSMHENTGKFYNRSNFHRALGYENHYSLMDMKSINKNYSYILDSSISKNDKLIDLIVSNNKFMTYITSYSAHVPYDSQNDNCNKNLYNLDDEKIGSELSCIYNLAHDTDEFIRILIEKLDKKGLLDSTVLVLASDHYMYGYSDTKKLYEMKQTNNSNLLQKVPFIIWSKDIYSKDIDKVMDTSDILPTILNLFDINYEPKYYVGTDVFDKEHENYIYFSSEVFYDGNLYYDSKDKITDENKDYINNTLKTINKKMWMNKSIIIGDYFNYKNN